MAPSHLHVNGGSSTHPIKGCNSLERCRADGIVPLRLERSRSDRRLHALDLREDVRELLLVTLELVVDPLPFPGEVGIRPESAHGPLRSEEHTSELQSRENL